MAAAVIILLKLLTQSVWETFYKKYIEPYITKKLYVILEGKEILEDREALSYVEGKAISIDIISLIVIIVFSILLVVFITKGVYSWRNSKENAHERGFALAARALINDLDYVLAAQMYRYSIDAVGHGKNKKRRIIIYHIDSECVEGVDINAIVQEEFFLEERYFRAIARFLTVYGSYESSRNKEELKKAKDGISEMLAELRKEFSALAPDSVEEIHCVHYAAYKGIQCTLGEEEWEGPIAGCSEETANVLRYAKKTGFLPAILLQSVYTFRNGRSHFKMDRVYWSYVPSEDIMPRGYKKMLVSLALSYELVQEKDEVFINSDLVKTVNSYLVEAIGGNNDASVGE